MFLKLDKKSFWIVVVLIIGFGLGSLTIKTTDARQEFDYEQRIQALEIQVGGHQQQIARLEFYQMQEKALYGGTYSAILYSTWDQSLALNDNLSWVEDAKKIYQGDILQNPYTCQLCGKLGFFYYVGLYDNAGNLIDKFDFSQIVQPGEMIVAWIDNSQHEGTSWSSLVIPNAVDTPAYYWNQQTGLAVGFRSIDGTYRNSN